MQRRVEPHDSLDDFPTPPWATRAIIEQLHCLGVAVQGQSVREPAANRGYMVAPLREFFAHVDASDVHDYGYGFPVRDYLFPGDLSDVDWTFCNPPFRLAQQFIERALGTSRVGVAMVVRGAFSEGVGRYEKLFGPNPESYVFQHVERVPMVKGRYDPAASTATAYSWHVWLQGFGPDSRFRRIAPCRKRLERADDVTIPERLFAGDAA